MVYFVSSDHKRARRSKRRNAEINITNLMDVMMVLLVVFMVAAPLMTSGIALNFAQSGRAQFDRKRNFVEYQCGQ